MSWLDTTRYRCGCAWHRGYQTHLCHRHRALAYLQLACMEARAGLRFWWRANRTAAAEWARAGATAVALLPLLWLLVVLFLGVSWERVLP
jgi:hypothetical protein